MASFEFDPDAFGVTCNTYGLYQPGRNNLKPDQLSVTASLREHQTSGKGQWLAVLETADQTGSNIHARWTSGYGKHETLIREITGDPNADLSTQIHEIAVGNNILQLEGVCGIDLDDFEPTISICGRYFAETSCNTQAKLVPLDDPARKHIGDLAIASSLEIMRLKQLTEGSIALEHCFDTPNGDFTEHVSLKFDLNN